MEFVKNFRKNDGKSKKNQPRNWELNASQIVSLKIGLYFVNKTFVQYRLKPILLVLKVSVENDVQEASPQNI